MSNDTFFVSKYGYKSICITLGLYLFSLLLDFDLLSTFTFLLFICTLYIFRNPERNPSHLPEESVLCVCDGIVSSVEKRDNKQVITIKSRCRDVSLLRSPFAAKVVDYKIMRGAQLDTDLEISSKLNENLTVIFQNMQNKKIEVRHTLGQNFLPIFFKNIANKNLAQSERYGLMLRGEVAIILDESAKVLVKKSDSLRAGETLIATL